MPSLTSARTMPCCAVIASPLTERGQGAKMNTRRILSTVLQLVGRGFDRLGLAIFNFGGTTAPSHARLVEATGVEFERVSGFGDVVFLRQPLAGEIVLSC